MEKVHSNIDESMSIASLIKDMPGKAAKNGIKTKNDVNFKDFIKPKNNEDARNNSNNILNKKQDYRDVKRNANDTRTERNDFKRQNTEDKSVKDDNSSNIKKAVDNKTTKDNKIDKSSKKDVIKNEKVEDKKQEDYEQATREIIALVNDKNIKPEELAEKLKEMLSEFKGDLSKVIENISNVSPKLADGIKDIFKMINQENLPQEKILNLINDIKQDEQIQKTVVSLLDQDLSNFDKSSLSDKSPLEDLRQMLEEVNDSSDSLKDILSGLKETSKKDGENLKANFEEIINSDNTQQSLKDVLSNLKNDIFVNQNNLNQDNIEVSNNNSENIEEMNINNQNLNIPTVKILGQAKASFTTGVINSPSAANLATFTKIVDEMRIAFRDNKTDFTMKLEPETLGKMSVKINSENGIFNASFFVESEKVKQMIENQLVMLRQAMLDKGINIQDINVQVGQNNEDLNYHKHIMEAANYSKRDNMDDLDIDFDLDTKSNPYIKDELFDERV